jgi:hypothetical protein
MISIIVTYLSSRWPKGHTKLQITMKNHRQLAAWLSEYI